LSMKKLIVGISGADGLQMGIRLLELLRDLPHVETHLVTTPNAARMLPCVCGMELRQVRELADYCYDPRNTEAAIASGSFQTDGMIVAPCSMRTLAAIAAGLSDNLLTRAADVCIKERRKTVLLTRETPLSLIHIRNMESVTAAGCVVLPPVLTFYSGAQTARDMVDHILGKALLQYDITLPGFRAWEGK